MNREDVLELVHQMLEEHRIEVGGRLEATPVTWEGMSMTVEEAKLVIQRLEAAKPQYQKAGSSTHIGGKITKLASGGAGLAAVVTGAALMLFPATKTAGVVTLISGIGAAGVGKIVGDGVRDIGTHSNGQAVQQIDAYIDSLKNAVIDSI